MLTRLGFLLVVGFLLPFFRLFWASSFPFQEAAAVHPPGLRLPDNLLWTFQTREAAGKTGFWRQRGRNAGLETNIMKGSWRSGKKKKKKSMNWFHHSEVAALPGREWWCSFWCALWKTASWNNLRCAQRPDPWLETGNYSGAGKSQKKNVLMVMENYNSFVSRHTPIIFWSNLQFPRGLIIWPFVAKICTAVIADIHLWVGDWH